MTGERAKHRASVLADVLDGHYGKKLDKTARENVITTISRVLEIDQRGLEQQNARNLASIAASLHTLTGVIAVYLSTGQLGMAQVEALAGQAGAFAEGRPPHPSTANAETE